MGSLTCWASSDDITQDTKAHATYLSLANTSRCGWMVGPRKKFLDFRTDPGSSEKMKTMIYHRHGSNSKYLPFLHHRHGPPRQMRKKKTNDSTRLRRNSRTRAKPSRPVEPRLDPRPGPSLRSLRRAGAGGTSPSDVRAVLGNVEKPVEPAVHGQPTNWLKRGDNQ